ncbi:MAG TPA: TMEM175 family protein [Acidimicrobiia bacterium]|nr:TMEM175 family protein [Acidimicrobiia bacterium]
MTPTEPEESGRGRDRAFAFSDGVFAIAITLLVLNFKVPHLSGPNVGRQLVHALEKERNVLIGFVISFYVIARFWLTHHRLSLRLRRVDGRFLTINLVLLSFIVFLPFPTEVLGLYGSTITAVVFYAGTMVCVGGLSLALWEYARLAHLMPPMSAAELRDSRQRGGALVVVFATSIPIAFVSTTAAQLWWALLVANQVLRRTALGRRVARSRPAR